MGKLNLNALKAGASESKPQEVKPAAGLGFLKKQLAAPEPAAEPEQSQTSQTDAQAEQVADVKPTPAVARGGLGFLKAKAAAATPATPTPAAPPPPPKPTPDVSDDLSALMDSEAGGGSKPTLASGKLSRFADEEPAIAPERELPAEMDKQMSNFVESLNSVYKIVHEPDLLGGVIKNIMMELAQKPEYRKLISPKDVHTMIKGMRDSMGMARIKKEESKAKRSGASKSKKKVEIEGVDDLLDSIGGFD